MFGWMHSAELLGEFAASPGDTFLVVAGSECTDCDAQTMVFVRALRAGPIARDSLGTAMFAYPGRVTDLFDSTVVVADTRLYWGACLSGRRPGLVQFVLPDSATQPGRVTVNVAEAAGGVVRESQFGWPLDSLFALRRVLRSGCTELAPRDRASEP